MIGTTRSYYLYICLGFFFFLSNNLLAQPGGNDCQSATPLCSFPVSSSNAGATADPPFTICGNPNWVENNVFYSFIAGSANMEFTVEVSNCQANGGMQGEVYYTDNCNTFDELACFTEPFPGGMPVNFTLSFSPIIGETYVLMFDGYGGDVCNFDVTLTEGELGSPTIDQVEGTEEVCANNIGNYIVDGAFSEFNWTINPPLGDIVGNPIESEVDIQWHTGGMAEVCVSGVHCGNPSAPTCMMVEIIVPPTTDEMYDICSNGSVECAEQTFFNPGVFPVTLATPQGCDSIVNCIINLLPPIPPTTATDELCGPVLYEICGEFYIESGIYNVACMGANGCDSLVILDLAILTPTPVISPPDSLECGANSTIILNGSMSNQNTANGGTTQYIWSGPGIVGNNTDETVVVNEAGTYCLDLIHERNGVVCTEMVCVEVFSKGQAVETPTLMGDTLICNGDSALYTVVPNGTAPVDSFTWTTPNNEPINFISNDSVWVNWAGSAGGQLCVNANSSCGASPDTCLNISTNQIPGPIGIVGPSSVCEGSVTACYLTGASNATSCTWTVPLGATFIQTADTIVIDLNGATSGEVCVVCENECGASDETCVPLTVNSAPPAPAISSGPTQDCAMAVATYCIDPTPNATSYEWISPAGTTVNTDVCLTVVWGSSDGQICVSAINDCGQSDPTCWNVDILPPPTAVLSGGGVVCEGSGESVETIITLTGNAPWTITYTLNNIPQPPLSINTSPFILPLNQPGTCVLQSVTDALLCSGTVSGQAILEEIPLPTASLSGGGNICENSGEQVNLEIALSGAAPWTVGWQVNSIDQAPLNINASPFTLPINEAQAGTINLTNVIEGNSCEGTINGSALIEIIGAPTVSMVETECNSTNTEYTITFNIDNGDAATYSISPMDGTLIGTVFTSNPITVGNGYDFTVTDVNNCNPVQVTAATVICNCTSESGNMEEAFVQVCGEMDFSASYNAIDEIFDGDDALCFVLHEGNIDLPLATNSTPDFTFLSGVLDFDVDYFICPVVGNMDGSGCVDLSDPCKDVGECTTVRFRNLPTATLGNDQDICIGDNASLSIDLTGNGPWQISYQDDSGSLIDLTATNSPFIFQTTPNNDFTYTLSAVEDSFCEGDVFGETTVSVHSAPTAIDIIEECDGANEFYTVAFEITGGDATTYNISPNTGALTGNIFTSDPIPTGQPYSFEIDDAMACGPTPLIGDHACQCATDAGGMSPTLLSYCIGESIVGDDAIGFVLDSNDLLIYFLHTSNGNALGTVISQNSIPQFDFDPTTMSTGTTYYISAVAGNDNGSGGIEINDACTDVALGTPVVFNDLPEATISGSTTLCFGENAEIEFTVQGTGPFTILYEVDGIPAMPLDVPIAGTFTQTITPPTTADVTLVSIIDNGTGCENMLSGSIDITVNQPVEAGTPLSSAEACENLNDLITLSSLLTGADLGGTWTDQNGTTVANGQVQLNTLPEGTHLYTYTVTGTMPCPVDEAIVSIIIHPNPTADAGMDQQLDCTNTSVTIGGSNTSTGMDYNWVGPIMVASEIQPTVDAQGNYTLTVTSPFGCTDTDEVFVSQSIEQPVPEISFTNVSCIGFSDGMIIIEIVTGGQSPYTYSFNGGAFSDVKEFIDLPAGTYDIEIQDALGCSSVTAITISEPTDAVIPFVSVSDISCFGMGDGSVNIDSITGGQAPYTCSFNGGAFNADKTFTDLSPGAYSIDIMDAMGCSSILEVNITEPEEVTVEIQGGQPMVNAGETLTLQLITTPPIGELDTILWSISTGDIACDTCAENAFLLNAETEFNVMIAENGCMDDDFLNVGINKNSDVFFPNAFSPNNDGVNERFSIYAGTDVTNIKSFLIFDRWGGAIFELYNFAPNNVDNGWDGTNRGQVMDAGVFVWFAEVEFLDETVKLFEGEVVLVR